jgi:hypothetical protein
VLRAAEAWGIPPWEVVRGPAVWFYRWVNEETLKAKLNDKTAFVDDGE